MIGTRTILLIGTALAASALTIPSAADAQSRARSASPAPISFGQTVTGRINAASPNCSAETPTNRVYSFTAEAGTRIEVTMQADDFDTLLEVGKMVDCAFVSMGTNDDGSGPEDGLNSRLTGTLPATGTYLIRATSFGEGTSAGPFTLTLNRLPPARPAPEPIAITMGQTLQGKLTPEDAILRDSTNGFDFLAGEGGGESIIDSGRAYHLYSLSGNAGDEMQIRMTSDDFDSFLEVGVNSPLGFSVAESNDDGDGDDDGLNSRLRITFQSAGTLIIRALPLSGNNFGEYSLIVEPVDKDDEATASASGAADVAADAPAE